MIPNTGPRGVAWWAGAIQKEGDRITDSLMAEMAANPRFTEAAFAHLRGSVGMLTTNPFALRLANDGVRFLLGLLSLYMDARGGLSRQAVREMFGGVGLSSPGRATAMLMHLRFINFIEPAAAQADRRTKFYVPTAGMKRAFIELTTMGLNSTAMLEPEAADFVPHFEEPRFFKGYVLALGESILAMFKRLEGEPRNMFADATAGHLMLYRIMLGTREDSYPPRDELPFVLTALAKEFRVARSHVRRTFDRAVTLGHLRYGHDGKSIVLSEPFRDHLTQHHAAMFINNLRCMAAARDYAQQATAG